MFTTNIKTIEKDEDAAKAAIEKVHRPAAEKKIGKAQLVGVDHALIPVLAKDSLEQIGTDVHVLSKWKVAGHADPARK